MLFSFLVYYIFYRFTFVTIFNNFFNLFYFFLVKKWYFDLIYNNLFVFNLLNAFYSLTFKLIDRGVVEFFGPLSIVRLVSYFSRSLSYLQTGYMYNYIFAMIIFIIFFIKVIFGYFSINSLLNFDLIVLMLSTVLFLNFKKN